MTVEKMLGDIAAAGGTLEIVDGTYTPFEMEAERLGLIKTIYPPDAWGQTVKLRLTNAGRQRIGLEPLTEPSAVSFFDRLLGWLRG